MKTETYDLLALNERDDAVSRVISHVLRLSEEGDYAPGERLPNEAMLSEQVGVSRTPVREAIKVLEAVGLVEVRRGVGTFLRPNTIAALGQLLLFQREIARTTPQQLYEARLMTERSAARLLAQHRTLEDLDRLREINQRLRDLAAQGADSEDLMRADIAFHAAIYDRCSNPLIGSLGRFVTALFAPWIKKSIEFGGGERAAANHDLLIGMIEAQNPGGASEAAVDRVVEEGLIYWQTTLHEAQ
tara:strand:+ start:8981 stop:9712 length:732 start_codon:yes stop_codon:yes gene_type:complete